MCICKAQRIAPLITKEQILVLGYSSVIDSVISGLGVGLGDHSEISSTAGNVAVKNFKGFGG